MKKKNSEKLLNWDAHYVGISRSVKLHQNCITLDEVALEAARQLFRFVPITIEDQIPVFTAAESGSSRTTESRKNSCWRKRKVLQVSSWLIIVTGAIYAYIGIEQVAKGNLPMGITYMSYATANIGLYFMAK